MKWASKVMESLHAFSGKYGIKKIIENNNNSERLHILQDVERIMMIGFTRKLFIEN